MFIQTQQTPNPNSLKFLTGKKVSLVGPIEFKDKSETSVTLIKNISLFHGLGVPLLLGVSRKSIISNVAKVEKLSDRVHGSISLAISALGQGVQVFRVHDVAETKQAFDLWLAVNFGE